MRSSLFRRTFLGVLAAVLVAVALFSIILLTEQRSRAQENYETEVRMQARQVAEYMTEFNRISIFRENTTLLNLINKKINYIYDTYSADIWIVSFATGHVQYVDRTWNTSKELSSEAVLAQLQRIQNGEEIRADGMFTELGSHIVTIGVPWTYNDCDVVGAVLLHIPVDQLHVSIRAVLPQVLLPGGAALLIGAILAMLIARSQISPIREIDRAVQEFSKGDLSRRVNLHCGGELEQLGNSINHMAEELSNLEDSRRSFVANVSHELRSPMTSIKGYIQAMLDGTIGDDDRATYLSVVLDETNRLTDLVRDLLDLSRLESGKFPMNIAPFDVNEMMRRILIRFEQRIDQKHIDVQIDFADDPCFALGDVSRINQVASNFIDNAVKFMTGDHSVLTLRTAREDKRIRVTVEDNGPGISEADLPYIMDRFYKADKAHTAGMGTGLGLSICKNILMQHNSQVEVTSEPGRTVFSFTLPATDAPQRTLPESTEQNPTK